MECNGGVGCNATKLLPVLSSWEFIGSSFWKGIGRISTYCLFFPFSFIESSGEDNSTSLCICVLYFSSCIFTCYIKITSLYATDYSAIGHTLKKYFSEL